MNVKSIAAFCCVAVATLFCQAEVPQDVAPVGLYDLGIVRKADTLVVYTATWCAPCQRLKPVLAGLKREGYTIIIYDVSNGSAENDKHGLEYTSLPTLYWLAGTKVTKKHEGYLAKAEITKDLKKPIDVRSDYQLTIRRLFDRSDMHVHPNGWVPR